jgi:hypothetical protein
MADFEIDPGTPSTSRHKRAVPPPPDATSAAQADDEAVLRERIPAAQAQVAAANMGVGIAQMTGFVLIGCCGQALGIMGRLDTWNGGCYLGILLALASMAAATWLTWTTRLPGHELTLVPVPPLEPPPRNGPQTGTQRIAQHQRRRDEIDTINALASDFAARRRVLTLATAGAILGSVCAWIIGAGGHDGAIALCATAAAIAGAAIGWRLAHGPGTGITDLTGDPAIPWPHVIVERLIVGVLPGAALLMSLIIGSPILWSLGLWIATAAATFALRKILIARAARFGLYVKTQDDDLGAFAEADDEGQDGEDEGEEDADAEADEEEIAEADNDSDDDLPPRPPQNNSYRK